MIMPHEFEVREEIGLDATPEQVWEAIATGPGIDSWFMGRNEVEPGLGGTTRMDLAGHSQQATLTAWEPARRFAIRSEENADGTFMAFEYLIEGRAGGSSVLRFVHSGFLGDDWEEQYDALSVGDRMYLEKLAVYLRHFPGRTATFTMMLPGPQVANAERVWGAFKGALGLTRTVAAGDRVRLSVDGLDPAEGNVEFLRFPSFLGIRTTDSIYLFIHGYQNTVVVEQHAFSDDVDEKETERAWQAWLAHSLA
jgi:uncharacterized protein YndB with AHSA1/START domain